jgi:hypothetical protein
MGFTSTLLCNVVILLYVKVNYDLILDQQRWEINPSEPSENCMYHLV